MKNFNYRWKNGSPPNREQAMQQEYLLEEGQFIDEEDQHLAEQNARKHLGVPTKTLDARRSILPKANPNKKDFLMW
ncbi:MAG: bromodomain-containing protein [Mastigocoleus sp.]